jgi:hypothetical protein
MDLTLKSLEILISLGLTCTAPVFERLPMCPPGATTSEPMCLVTPARYWYHPAEKINRIQIRNDPDLHPTNELIRWTHELIHCGFREWRIAHNEQPLRNEDPIEELRVQSMINELRNIGAFNGPYSR